MFVFRPVQECAHLRGELAYKGEQQMSIEDPSITESLHQCRGCGTSVLRDAPVASEYEWQMAAAHLAAQLAGHLTDAQLAVIRRALLDRAADVPTKLAVYALMKHGRKHTEVAA